MGSIGSYATNKGNAKSALAQGRAARDAAYVNAANTEAESASALRLAAENRATARRYQTAATASVRASRLGMMELGSWAASPAKSDFSFYNYTQKWNPYRSMGL